MSRERDRTDRGGGDGAESARPSDYGDGASPHGSESETAIGEDLQRLRELFLTVGAPEQDEAAWSAVQARIYHDVPAVRPTHPRARRPVAAFVGLAAAAVLGAILIARLWWLGGAIQTPAPGPEEPYPVAEADDVNIISMDARDVACLVVGEPPVSGELVFVKMEDVRILKCKRCPKCGNKGRLERGEVPMVVVSAAGGGDAGDE